MSCAVLIFAVSGFFASGMGESISCVEKSISDDSMASAVVISSQRDSSRMSDID